MALTHTASYSLNSDRHRSSLTYRNTNSTGNGHRSEMVYEPDHYGQPNRPTITTATDLPAPPISRARRQQTLKQLAMLPHIQKQRQSLHIQTPPYPHTGVTAQSTSGVNAPGSLLQLQDDKIIHNPKIVQFQNEELVRSVEWNTTTSSSPLLSDSIFPESFRLQDMKSDSRVCLSIPGSQLRDLQADAEEEAVFQRGEDVSVRRFDSLTEKWIPLGQGRVIGVVWTRCWTGTKGYEYIVSLKNSNYLHSERFSPYLGEIYRGTLPPPAILSVNYVYVIIHKPLPTGFADPSGNQYCLSVVSPAVALSRVNGNQYRVRSLCSQYKNLHFLVNEVFPYTAETVDACKFNRFHVLKATGELDRTSYSHQFGLRMKEQGLKPFILPWEQE